MGAWETIDVGDREGLAGLELAFLIAALLYAATGAVVALLARRKRAKGLVVPSTSG